MQSRDRRADRLSSSALRGAVDQTLTALRQAGLKVKGYVTHPDPLTSIRNAFEIQPADEIVISTHPEGRSNWLERDVVGAARERFDVPITHVTNGVHLPTFLATDWQTLLDRHAGDWRTRALSDRALRFVDEMGDAELAALRQHQVGKPPLLLAREARHVGVGEDVGGVFVIAGVGNRQTDFVELRSPVEKALIVVLFVLASRDQLLQQGQRRGRHDHGIKARRFEVIAQGFGIDHARGCQHQDTGQGGGGDFTDRVACQDHRQGVEFDVEEGCRGHQPCGSG